MTTKDKLETAQENLNALQDDLAGYQQLLKRNQDTQEQYQAAYRLKAKDAPTFEELTAAKTAVLTAKELLDQHISDIEQAENEVKKLSETLKREHDAAERNRITKELEKLEASFYEHHSAIYSTTTNHLQAMAKAKLKHQAFRDELRAYGGTHDGLPNHLNPSRLSGQQSQRIKCSEETQKLASLLQSPYGRIALPDSYTGALSSILDYLLRQAEKA